MSESINTIDTGECLVQENGIVRDRDGLFLFRLSDLYALKQQRDELVGLLKRCLPIIESDVQMIADLTRFSPLDAESQAAHDTTEYDSERLVREIPRAIAKARG